MNICENCGCLCPSCKYYDNCPTDIDIRYSNDCPGAYCWDCDEGSECVKECNRYKRGVNIYERLSKNYSFCFYS